MYVTRCGDDIDQRFKFIETTSDEILIKVGNGENKCWERDGSAVILRPCDENNSLQRWFTPNGSYGGSRFEFSQRGFDSKCVSTVHHPKEKEVLELISCPASRNTETAFWEKY
jgi:hypothetical protein